MPHLHREDYSVADVAIRAAREMVEEFHYAHGASNTATYLHGLFDLNGRLKGIAWWIPPTKAAAFNTYPDDWRGVLALSRLVIHPDVPTNGASFLLGKSMKLIDRKRWPCLVTYADEWRGHRGQIYKATNWEYIGITKPEPVYVRDGRMMGRKRGPTTLTHEQMIESGFEFLGRFPKHKFVQRIA